MGGGQTPLYRRLPKWVGKPTGPGHTKKIYGLVKLSMLNTQPEGSTVDYAALIESRAATKDKFKLKKVVSSPGGLTVKGLTVKAHAFTSSAKAAIEENGGTCVLLSPTTQLPLEAAWGEAALFSRGATQRLYLACQVVSCFPFTLRACALLLGSVPCVPCNTSLSRRPLGNASHVGGKERC